MRAIDRYEINTNLKIVCFDFGSGGDCLFLGEWGSISMDHAMLCHVGYACKCQMTLSVSELDNWPGPEKQ